MSEFSESFHIRTNNKEAGEQLLETLGVEGLVFDATNGWVTVVPEGELNSQIGNMANAYDGIMLHYMYAEDHAWMTNLFNNGEPLSRYICMWDPEFDVQDAELNIEEYYPLLQHAEDGEKLKAVFLVESLEQVFDINPAYTFAELLGLEHYKWLSGNDV